MFSTPAEVKRFNKHLISLLKGEVERIAPTELSAQTYLTTFFEWFGGVERQHALDLFVDVLELQHELEVGDLTGDDPFDSVEDEEVFEALNECIDGTLAECNETVLKQFKVWAACGFPKRSGGRV